MDWQNMKSSVAEALAKLRDLSLSEARKLSLALTDAGVSLEAVEGSLKAKGTPLTKDQRDKIKRYKAELLSILGGTEQAEPVQAVKLKADSFCLQASMADNGITDFVLAPKLEGAGGFDLRDDVAGVILEGASPEWRAKVQAFGGLRIYTPSQWQTAKKKLEAALA